MATEDTLRQLEELRRQKPWEGQGTPEAANVKARVEAQLQTTRSAMNAMLHANANKVNVADKDRAGLKEENNRLVVDETGELTEQIEKVEKAGSYINEKVESVRGNLDTTLQALVSARNATGAAPASSLGTKLNKLTSVSAVQLDTGDKNQVLITATSAAKDRLVEKMNAFSDEEKKKLRELIGKNQINVGENTDRFVLRLDKPAIESKNDLAKIIEKLDAEFPSHRQTFEEVTDGILQAVRPYTDPTPAPVDPPVTPPPRTPRTNEPAHGAAQGPERGFWGKTWDFVTGFGAGSRENTWKWLEKVDVSLKKNSKEFYHDPVKFMLELADRVDIFNTNGKSLWWKAFGAGGGGHGHGEHGHGDAHEGAHPAQPHNATDPAHHPNT
jgi:hypothetical protein